MTISRNEWLKALGDAVEPVDPDALTVAELADMFSIPRKTMYERIRALVAAKKAIRTVKLVANGHGHPRRVFAYRLIKGVKP